jgi:tetratricopeptide (TPR) repeat protein
MALGLMAMAVPASAQSGQVKGKVVDMDGKPIEGASVTIAYKDTSRKHTVKTDKGGNYIQIGLAPGDVEVLAEKDNMSMSYPARVQVRQPATINFQLVPGMKAGGPPVSAEMAKEQAALKVLLDAAVAAGTAGDHDTAIAKFNEAIAMRPDCANCYYGMGFELSQKKDYEKAEAALKKAIELKPDLGDAYSALATIYNAQKRFDEAAKAGEEAARLGGGAGGGGNADNLYNQGVILWNQGKIPEAKKMFEQAVAANPSHADSYYQLGMASINEGKMDEAATAFEKYLSLAPTGQFAAQAKGILGQIKK